MITKWSFDGFFEWPGRSIPSFTIRDIVMEDENEQPDEKFYIGLTVTGENGLMKLGIPIGRENIINYNEYIDAKKDVLEQGLKINASFNLRKYKTAQKNAMQRKEQPSNWYRQAAEWGDFSNEDEKLNRRYTPGIDPNDYIVEGTPVCNVSLGDDVTDGRGHFFKVEKISLNEDNECESMATIRPYRNIDVETGKPVDPDTHTLHRAVQDIRMITQTDIENVLDVMKRIKQTKQLKPNFNRLRDIVMPRKQIVPVRF